MQIKIYKDGNVMRVGPIDDSVAAILRRELTYTKKRYIADPRERRALGKRVANTLVECFKVKTVNDERQIVTNSGYLRRVVTALRKKGHEVKVLKLRSNKKADTFKPNWKSVDDFELRHKQKEVLEAIVDNERGQACWATGAGKSFMVPLICMLFPKANIVVTTKHTAVLEDLFKNLSRHLPSVGINYSKRKLKGRRVMCCSTGTLHHLDPEKVDLLIADEVHELATDKMIEKFAKFRFSRMLGLSANYQDRFDGADFELEGIFGPLLTDMTYEEGVDHGMIVPIEVHWQDMRMDRNPAANKDSDVARNRHGIWRNDWRNAKIAENVAEHEGAQILITVKTFDHACHLKKYLPDFTLVYASTEDKGDLIDRYIKWGLITEDEPVMTTQRLTELKQQFESGELKKVIATTVWNRGVNFKNLQVLIRADAGASVIDGTQIPGRLSRTTDDGEKTCGILIDYMDQFDSTLRARAMKRKATYKSKGWAQIEPEIKR